MKAPPKITLTLTPEELDLLCDAAISAIIAEKERVSLSEKYPGDEYWTDIKQDAQAKIAKLDPIASMICKMRVAYRLRVKP